MHDTYSLVVVLEGDVGVSPLKCVVGSVIPCNVINPVGFVVVPKNVRSRERGVEDTGIKLGYVGLTKHHFQARHYTDSRPLHINSKL